MNCNAIPDTDHDKLVIEITNRVIASLWAVLKTSKPPTQEITITNEQRWFAAFAMIMDTKF